MTILRGYVPTALWHTPLFLIIIYSFLHQPLMCLQINPVQIACITCSGDGQRAQVLLVFFKLIDWDRSKMPSLQA